MSIEKHRVLKKLTHTHTHTVAYSLMGIICYWTVSQTRRPQ